MSINKASNLVWIDLEMTGLNPDTDRIIEIATIVTDAQGRYKFRSVMPVGYSCPPGGATDRLLQQEQRSLQECPWACCPPRNRDGSPGQPPACQSLQT